MKGPPENDGEGEVMVPIQPNGAIDLTDLAFANGGSPNGKNSAWDMGAEQQKTEALGMVQRATVMAEEALRMAKDSETAREAVRLAQEANESAREALATAGQGTFWMAGEIAGRAMDAAKLAYENTGAAEWMAAGASESDEAHSEVLEILLTIGFDADAAREATKRCSSVEAAVQYIMMNQSADAIAGPAEQKADSSSAKTSLIESLTAIGFSDAQAQEASRRCSSVEAAVEWLAGS